MLKIFFTSFMMLAMLISVLGRITYFNRPIYQCYSGNITITNDNKDLLSLDKEGSCLKLGLEKIECSNTYGCFVTSSRPSESPKVGDILSFGCGKLQPCNELPGFNCCTDDNCNCFEQNDYEIESKKIRKLIEKEANRKEHHKN